MKKLAIVLLLVMSCRRQVEVGSPTAVNTPGADSPRAAVTAFMASAKAQDLEAMANIWGSVEGPIRNTREREHWERREVIMMGCLKHDSYRIVGEAPAAGGERLLMVELTYGDLTRTTSFMLTRGPSNRWFVRIFEIDPLQAICTAR